jgi:hypothetical protein
MTTPEALALQVVTNIERVHGSCGGPERRDLLAAIAAAIEHDRREILSSDELVAELSRRHRKPVMAVEKYCEAMNIWWRVFMEKFHKQYKADKARGGTGTSDGLSMESLRWVHLSIRKSNLLYRLIYLGEKLRTRPCTTPHGRTNDVCKDCDGTGFLREEA